MRRDLGRGAAGPIGVFGLAGEEGEFTLLHRSHSSVPALDHLACTLIVRRDGGGGGGKKGEEKAGEEEGGDKKRGKEEKRERRKSSIERSWPSC